MKTGPRIALLLCFGILLQGHGVAIAAGVPWYAFSNVSWKCVDVDKLSYRGQPLGQTRSPQDFVARVPGAITHSNSDGSIIFIDFRETSVSGPHEDDLKLMGYFRNWDLH
jgi:hypothetical protein